MFLTCLVRAAVAFWHFERDPIPYALETDWPVGAAGFEPLHLEIRTAELDPAPEQDLGVDRAPEICRQTFRAP